MTQTEERLAAAYFHSCAVLISIRGKLSCFGLQNSPAAQDGFKLPFGFYSQVVKLLEDPPARGTLLLEDTGALEARDFTTGKFSVLCALRIMVNRLSPLLPIVNGQGSFFPLNLCHPNHRKPALFEMPNQWTAFLCKKKKKKKPN